MARDLHTYLQQLAAARGGTATVLLDLDDGQPPIRCVDERQAFLIASLWQSFVHCQMGERRECLMQKHYNPVQSHDGATTVNPN